MVNYKSPFFSHAREIEKYPRGIALRSSGPPRRPLNSRLLDLSDSQTRLVIRVAQLLEGVPDHRIASQVRALVIWKILRVSSSWPRIRVGRRDEPSSFRTTAGRSETRRDRPCVAGAATPNPRLNNRQ